MRVGKEEDKRGGKGKKRMALNIRRGSKIEKRKRKGRRKMIEGDVRESERKIVGNMDWKKRGSTKMK